MGLQGDIGENGILQIAEDGLTSTSCWFLSVHNRYSLVISLRAKKFILIEVMKQWINGLKLTENISKCYIQSFTQSVKLWLQLSSWQISVTV